MDIDKETSTGIWSTPLVIRDAFSTASLTDALLSDSQSGQSETQIRDRAQAVVGVPQSSDSLRPGDRTRSGRNRDRRGSSRDRRRYDSGRRNNNNNNKNNNNNYNRRSYHDSLSDPRGRRSYLDHDQAPLRSTALNYDNEQDDFKPQGGQAEHGLSKPSFDFNIPVLPHASTAEGLQLSKDRRLAEEIERRRVQRLIEHWVPRAVEFAKMRNEIGLSDSDIEVIEKAIAEENERLAKKRDVHISTYELFLRHKLTSYFIVIGTTQQ